jgi:glycerate 2-kinase
MSLTPLADDALAIWRAGVAAVESQSLVQRQIRVEDGRLKVAGIDWPLTPATRLLVVGAGKAGAGMAAGVEAAVAGTPFASRLSGWVNVPEDCVRVLPHIHLHPARPAGVNEPTEAGIVGTEAILKIVQGARPCDLVLVLLSGGGSALMPAPVSGLTLADKQSLTRLLSRRGATIQQLNAVRSQLSRVKGGGLARAAAGAGHVATLIISDVIGDPLDVIASGPNCPTRSSPEKALSVLAQFDPDRTLLPVAIYAVLERRRSFGTAADHDGSFKCPVTQHLLGTNRVSCLAAAEEAARRGYRVVEIEQDRQGEARVEGIRLAERAIALQAEARATGESLCLVSGGEPVVTLPCDRAAGKGGRNQQLALAALAHWWTKPITGVVLLSAGTDGEDGPTTAAGGLVDASVLATAQGLGEHPDEALATCDAFPYLERVGGLVVTGPTHTNVMDLRILLARPGNSPDTVTGPRSDVTR